MSHAPTIPHYVGITGIQHPSHVSPLCLSAQQNGMGPNSSHHLMLGCLVSANTVRNGPPVNTGRPDRHVATVATLQEILDRCVQIGAIGMLHFELHKEWPGTNGDARDVLALVRQISKNTPPPPIQLNGVLLPEEICEIHNESGAALVFQLRKEISSRGESELLRYMEKIVGSVSKILMDPSAGSGEHINLTGALELVAAIEARFPKAFTFGFAGGLGGAEPAQIAHTTQVVETLRRALGSSNFSVDTETRVRVPGQTPGTDILSLSHCQTYFEAVARGFTR